jgi:hypothetical protein
MAPYSMNFIFKSGGQFQPAQGGQFESARGGQLKPASGGQYDRHFQSSLELTNFFLKANFGASGFFCFLVFLFVFYRETFLPSIFSSNSLPFSLIKTGTPFAVWIYGYS